MKKIIAICTALILTCLLVVAFTACGDKNTTDDSTRTSTPAASQSTTMLPNENDGKVSDVSESGKNGVAGDIVSDISRGLTELSEAVTR